MASIAYLYYINYRVHFFRSRAEYITIRTCNYLRGIVIRFLPLRIIFLLKNSLVLFVANASLRKETRYKIYGKYGG